MLSKLGSNRIKTLVNDGADEKDVLLAVKHWLSRGISAGKTDVYVFFAGHGLARERLFFDIASANPRSVTVFLDTC